MNRKLGLLLTVVLGLTLSACASNKKDDTPAPDTAPDVTQTGDTRNAFDTGYSLSELRAMGIDGNPLQYTTVYFEYNSSAIDQRSEVIALAHARELVRRGGARVNLEGHADERGTRDYNLALGERRAQAVGNLMRTTDNRSDIQTVSYGEERPVDPGHNEAAWQKNRRVEIKY